MNKSIWGKIETNSNTTNKNIETDILIIGGGITGMTSLLYLLPKNKKTILIEANKVGNGITNKTTGKINIMQEYNYQKIENITNNKTALKYLESQIYATNEIKKRIFGDELRTSAISILMDSYSTLLHRIDISHRR